MTLSLEDFAKNHKTKSGRPCWACGIPERAEIEGARQRGVPMPVIVMWLVDEKGYDRTEATISRLQNHLALHVR